MAEQVFSFKGSANPAQSGWCQLTPTPRFKGVSGQHVYIRSDRDAIAYGRVQWSNRVLGEGVPEKNFGGHTCDVDWVNRTITFHGGGISLATDPPPPGPFEDTAARRKGINAHVKALKAATLAMLSFDNLDDAVSGLKLLEADVVVSLNPRMTSEEIAAKVAETEANFEKVRGITAALKPITDEAERKSILRHLAHVFEIPKGSTSLR